MPADRNVVGERSETLVSPPLVTAIIIIIIIYTRRRVLPLQLLRCRYNINPRGTGIFDRGSPIRIIVRPRTHLNRRRRDRCPAGRTGFFLLLLLYPRQCSSAPGACIVFLETNIILLYTECLSASFHRAKKSLYNIIICYCCYYTNTVRTRSNFWFSTDVYFHVS